MADRVVLHVGTMKSGSSYLQQVLAGGGLDHLPDAFFPGGTVDDQALAVRDVLGTAKQRSTEEWDALAAEVAGRGGVAVYSHELLSFVRRPRARRIVESFGGAPVEVVLTVRDQHRAIPAQWQSYTRNRGTDDWAGYLRRLTLMTADRDERGRVERSYRRAQDIGRILRRWSGHEEVTGVSVVVVPPPGSDPAELWRRFCAAARLPGGTVPQTATRVNESLGYASCDLLRRLNVHFTDLEKLHFRRIRESLLAALLPLRPEEGRPQLDRAGAQLARELNRAVVRAVTDAGVRVVGPLEEVPGDDLGGTAPASVPAPDPHELHHALVAVWSAAAAAGTPPADLDQAVAALAAHLVARHR